MHPRVLVILEVLVLFPELIPANKTKTEQIASFLALERRLVDHLFENYDRNIPALYARNRYEDGALPLSCNTTLMYAKLLSIDEPKQSVMMIIDFFLFYTDPRLSWNPEDFDGITQFPLAKKETVWIPDVLPFDIITFTETLPEDRQIVNVYANGTISYYTTAVVDFICSLNLDQFPFDSQECFYRLTSFNSPITELDIKGNISPVFNHDSVGNGEWTFTGVDAETTSYEQMFNFSFSLVVFSFKFKRSTTHYFMLMIIPSFILTLLCVAGLFWSPIDSESYMDNLNLGFAAILAMMFVLQMTTQNMPKISQVDKLSRFSMANLVLITAASVIVMLMGKSQQIREKTEKELPNPTKTRIQKTKTIIAKYLHLVCLILFGAATIANFILLLDSLSDYLADERILIDHLFADYNREQPATYSRVRADPTAQPRTQTVNVTMMYGNLLTVDEPEQTINIIVETFMEWTDSRLAWNSSEYKDIEVILVTRNKVWIPDVTAYDASSYTEFVPVDRQNVVIFSNGTVSLFISAVISYNCELDISDFPFDDQICAVKFSCYYSTNQELRIRAAFDSQFNYSQMSSNAWAVIESGISYREFHIAMHHWNYSEVNFMFTLRRSDTYYVVLIIIPAYVLTFLCFAGLFWSPISHDTYMEKLNLAYAGILAMVLILQMTTTEMPKTSQLPMLCLSSPFLS